MNGPWRNLIDADDIDIVAPDGTVRSRVKGYYSGKQFIIEDMTVDVQPGDEIRRLLPNGKEEAFAVVDPKFYKNGPFGSHYQVAITRRGSFAPHSGGNYSIHMSGANARVNIDSTDNSTNVAGRGNLFGNLRHVIDHGVADERKRSELIGQIGEIEKAKDRPSFLAAYQRLISTAADHVTVLAPFLPALMELVTKL